jgi:hypothetical protein
VPDIQVSREAMIVFFTLKLVRDLQTLEGVCYYLGYLKNILLDRNSGMLTVEY